jgi:hypothetical protein
MFLASIVSRIQAYLRYRETIRQLSLLSDRELDDLGRRSRPMHQGPPPGGPFRFWAPAAQLASIARSAYAVRHDWPACSASVHPWLQARRDPEVGRVFDHRPGLLG